MVETMIADTPDPAAVRATVARLIEAVGRMTPGEWEYDSYSSLISRGGRKVVTTFQRERGDDANEQGRADIEGVAALRNAAPVLIAVAESAVGLVEWFDDAAEDGDWCPVCGNDIDELTTLWIPHKAHCPWPGLRAALARLAVAVGDG